MAFPHGRGALIDLLLYDTVGVVISVPYSSLLQITDNILPTPVQNSDAILTGHFWFRKYQYHLGGCVTVENQIFHIFRICKVFFFLGLVLAVYFYPEVMDEGTSYVPRH